MEYLYDDLSIEIFKYLRTLHLTSLDQSQMKKLKEFHVESFWLTEAVVKLD